jgi:hypothetical protein
MKSHINSLQNTSHVTRILTRLVLIDLSAAFETKCKAAFAPLYNIGWIRKCIDDHTAEALFQVLVHIP